MLNVLRAFGAASLMLAAAFAQAQLSAKENAAVDELKRAYDELDELTSRPTFTMDELKEANRKVKEKTDALNKTFSEPHDSKPTKSKEGGSNKGGSSQYSRYQ